MNGVVPGGLAGALGALQFDVGARKGVAPRAVESQRPAAAASAPAVSRPAVGFEAGLFQARAVGAPDKAAAAQQPPNPNLPRGSIIDLKI